MNILLITPTLDIDGGVASHVALSAELLAASGHQVRVLGGTGSGRWFEEIVGLTTGVQRPSVRAAVRASVGGSDVVHIHNVDDPLLVSELASLRPTVVSCHGWVGCPSGQPYFASGRECDRARGPACVPNMLLRNCKHRKDPRFAVSYYRDSKAAVDALGAAHRTVAHSRAVIRRLVRNGVTNAVSVPLPISETGDALPFPSGPPRIIFAGRLVEPKGVRVLLRAMRHFDGAVDVCGSGWQQDALMRQAASGGLSHRVRFHGWCDSEELTAHYRAAQLAVVPSLWPEPFGLAGPEAMIRGRAVVASNTGGTAEWLDHESNGLAVPPGEPRLLGEAIRSLLQEPDRLRRMGVKGRADVLERFSGQRYVASITQVYEDAARAHATS